MGVDGVSGVRGVGVGDQSREDVLSMLEWVSGVGYIDEGFVSWQHCCWLDDTEQLKTSRCFRRWKPGKYHAEEVLVGGGEVSNKCR